MTSTIVVSVIVAGLCAFWYKLLLGTLDGPKYRVKSIDELVKDKDDAIKEIMSEKDFKAYRLVYKVERYLCRKPTGTYNLKADKEIHRKAAKILETRGFSVKEYSVCHDVYWAETRYAVTVPTQEEMHKNRNKLGATWGCADDGVKI